MKVIPAQPYVWHRMPSGHLCPPPALWPKERMFLATDEGLIEIACIPQEPQFQPERGDLIHSW